jgi:hypothetical protein
VSKSYDRAEIMRAAWAQWRYALLKGWHLGKDPWTFAACLRIAHRAARQRQYEVSAFHAKGKAKRDYIFLRLAA